MLRLIDDALTLMRRYDVPEISVNLSSRCRSLTVLRNKHLSAKVENLLRSRNKPVRER
jgi:hypothetical protein